MYRDAESKREDHICKMENPGKGYGISNIATLEGDEGNKDLTEQIL